MEKIKHVACVTAAGCGLGLGGVTPQAQPANGLSAEATALPIFHKDYSFGYWKNGMRKHADDMSKDELCLETGHYGLALDMANLDKARFGTLADELDYEGALATDGTRLDKLAPAELKIELEKDGRTFRALSCEVDMRKTAGQLKGARLWESARYVQHFDFQKLVFKDDTGERLVADARLAVLGWPGSLGLTAEMSPGIDYKSGPELGVRGNGHCIVEKPHTIPHEPGLENERFTVETWIKIPEDFYQDSKGWVLCKNKNEVTEGNYGFSIGRGRVSATMNIGGKGRQNVHSLNSAHHALQPDRWHHLAMTYDGKNFSLYVDGRFLESKEVGKKRVPGTGAMTLGQRGDGFGGLAPVILDQIRVWNRPLDKNELSRHARNPAAIGNRAGLTYENNFETGATVTHQVWENAKMNIRLKSRGHDWQASQQVPGKWGVGDFRKVTVNCSVTGRNDQDTTISVAMKENQLPPVIYDQEFNCYVARVDRPKRSWPTGYSEIRNYDEIDITIDSQGKKPIPFLLEMIHPANITGLCPILCEKDGTPTGIPVQLSKNWHYTKMGSYLRAYALLPAVQGKKHYKLRIVYGFYGTVPSASHAQLSLVGYGGNGRWDQLAIGCWGETYCMDMDMSCVDVSVTDVRMLMARNRQKGKSWGWTDAGWGGDWLGLKDAKGQKHYFNGIRTAYLAHGPCLSEVKYDGFYGARREVDLSATVRTLRTDDHARTFSTMSYRFDKAVKAEGWLFKMGRTGGYVTPKITYGNAAGLLKEHQVPDGLKMGSDFLQDITLTGEGPWWVAFPGAHHNSGKDWGTGYRAMVIRSYKVVAGGKEHANPVIAFPAFRGSADGKSNVDFLLTAPVGVEEFKPGDSVEIDMEWITLPRTAEDYYGPNQSFRKHVAANPSSWKTTHREAVGNDLKVTVDGGNLLHPYPIIIEAQKEEVSVDITGGVGFVPIRFEGLKHAKGYALYQLVDSKEIKLDQSAHGNDFWQVDHDAKSNTFKMTFNLPLDGKANSKWLLRPTAPTFK